MKGPPAARQAALTEKPATKPEPSHSHVRARKADKGSP